MSNRPSSSRSTPGQTPKPNKVWWANPLTWVAGLVAIVIAIVIVVTISGGDEPNLADSGAGDDQATQAAISEAGFAEILGSALPTLSEPDAAIGVEAPTLSAQTFTGERVQIGGDGTARLYGFFAHWCPHCQAELPDVGAWLHDNELPDGVEVVAISTGLNPAADNYPPSAWFEREQWPATVVVDDEAGSLAQGFGLSAFPFWVAVDADGNVAFRSAGRLPIEQFTELLDILDPANQA